MPNRVTPFLMFTGEAGAAIALYLDVFDGARVVSREERADGKIQGARIEIAGQPVMLFDSPVPHAFGFTPASSLFVECATRDEFERVFAKLSTDGRVMMEPADYGFSTRFAWLDDRFGVSWQLNLP